MKNVLSILISISVLVLFITCSDDEAFSHVEESNKTYFNPPTWIQGKWGYFENDNSYEFRFIRDNFFVNNGAELDYNAIINMANVGTNKLIVEEIQTDKSYKLSLIGGGFTAEFEFEKVDDKRILHISSGIGVEMYKK